LNKNNIYKTKLDKNHIYNFVAGFIAEKLECNILKIRIDKSKAKIRDQNIFNEHFKNRSSCKSENFSIFHSYSHKWSGIQFADIFAWSYFQKYEKNNPEFVELIKLETVVIMVEISESIKKTST